MVDVVSLAQVGQITKGTHRLNGGAVRRVRGVPTAAHRIASSNGADGDAIEASANLGEPDL